MGQKSKTPIIIISIGICAVLYFVWPTQYRYDHTNLPAFGDSGTSYLVRTERLTGETEVLFPTGWISLKKIQQAFAEQAREEQAREQQAQQEQQAEDEARKAQEAKAQQERQARIATNKPLYAACMAEAKQKYIERWNNKCAEIADKWQLDYNSCMERGDETFCLSLYGRKPPSSNCELPYGHFEIDESYQAAKNACASQYPTW